MKRQMIGLSVLVLTLVWSSQQVAAASLFANQRSGDGCCDFGQISPTDASVSGFTNAANSGLTGMAYDSNNDILYGITNASPQPLYTVNQTSGALTLIANTNLFDPVGLAFDDLTGTLWASGNGNVGQGIDGKYYKLNTTTGVPTLTLNAGMERVDALAFGNGKLYVLPEPGSGPIMVVNQTTGDATSIGSALPNLASWQALAFDRDTDLLYAGACCGPPALYSVDPDTGSTLHVGDVGSFERVQALAPSVRVPEPATVSLLGMGALGLMRRRR